MLVYVLLLITEAWSCPPPAGGGPPPMDVLLLQAVFMINSLLLVDGVLVFPLLLLFSSWTWLRVMHNAINCGTGNANGSSHESTSCLKLELQWLKKKEREIERMMIEIELKHDATNCLQRHWSCMSCIEQLSTIHFTWSLTQLSTHLSYSNRPNVFHDSVSSWSLTLCNWLALQRFASSSSLWNKFRLITKPDKQNKNNWNNLLTHKII